MGAPLLARITSELARLQSLQMDTQLPAIQADDGAVQHIKKQFYEVGKE